MAIFMGPASEYLTHRLVGLGSSESIRFREDELVEIARSYSAASILLAHNHPSQECRPSGCDLATTANLQEHLKGAGLELRDHLVVTRTSVFSIAQGEALK